MYETKFENGEEITDYQAVAYAEGFETANSNDTIKAWSYICGKKLYLSLQGFFGRTIRDLIEEEFLQSDGTVNWNVIEERLTT